MLSVKMALRSIGANKLRAALTMLGIIIGVMALVVLVSLVDSATSSITEEVSSLGSSLLTVRVSDDKGRPVKLEDLQTWVGLPWRPWRLMRPRRRPASTGRKAPASTSTA